MQTIVIDMQTWRAEIEIPDSIRWYEVCNQISMVTGIPEHGLIIAVPRLDIFEAKAHTLNTKLANLVDGDHVMVTWKSRISPLIESALRGNIGAIERWVASGANLNVVNEYGMTPLMVASRFAQVGSVIKLLELGADPERLDRDGRTALHHVALGSRYGNDTSRSTIVKLLIQAGCDPQVRDKHESTAAELADAEDQFQAWIDGSE